MKFSGQFKEDEYLYTHFFKNVKNGISIEAGASNGILENNTKIFEDELNWKTINVEPLPDWYSELVINRPNSININAALHPYENDKNISFFIPNIPTYGLKNHLSSLNRDNITKYNTEIKSINVKSITFNKIISDNNLTKIDLFILDIEGYELEFLKSFNNWLVYPEVFVIEIGHIDENEVNKIISPIYKLYGKLSVNNIYVKKSSISYTIGIGDLIILKEYCLKTGNNFDIIEVNKKLLNCRADIKYIEFFKQLANKLFDNCEVIVKDNCENVNGALIRNNLDIYYLYDLYKFEHPYTEITTSPYIIFHTRFRLSTEQSVNLFKREQNKLINFFKNFKTKYTIIIMGEKEIEENLETKGSIFFYSLYNIFSNMFKNNTIIDLTSNSLSSSNTIENFDKELHIINKAFKNITFGEGGNYVICCSFSKNNLSYINLDNHTGHMPHPYDKFGYRDLDLFLSELGSLDC
jgi:FkbM family methyltransferase